MRTQWIFKERPKSEQIRSEFSRSDHTHPQFHKCPPNIRKNEKCFVFIGWARNTKVKK